MPGSGTALVYVEPLGGGRRASQKFVRNPTNVVTARVCSMTERARTGAPRESCYSLLVLTYAIASSSFWCCSFGTHG